MEVKRSDYVTEQVLKNLLTAQKQAADKGNAKETILLSKFLLHTFNHRNDIRIKLRTESDEERCKNPIE
jgi:hypothetical protein